MPQNIVHFQRSLEPENKRENPGEERIPLPVAKRNVGHSWENQQEYQYKFSYKRVLEIAIAIDCPPMPARHFKQSQKR